MSTLTIRLPDDKHERLKALAKPNAISVNKLIDELATVALANFDARGCGSRTGTRPRQYRPYGRRVRNRVARRPILAARGNLRSGSVDRTATTLVLNKE